VKKSQYLADSALSVHVSGRFTSGAGRKEGAQGCEWEGRLDVREFAKDSEPSLGDERQLGQDHQREKKRRGGGGPLRGGGKASRTISNLQVRARHSKSREKVFRAGPKGGKGSAVS